MKTILQEDESPNNRIKIIDKYNALISNVRGKLFFGLGYDQGGELFYNKAYFSPNQNITEAYIHGKIEEGNIIISQLKEIVEQIENDTILNDVQKKLIIDSIKKSIGLLMYHQHAIYIEAEKGGYPLSNTDRIYHRKEVVKLEDALYGKSITTLEGRKDKVIHKLHEVYLQNNTELTPEEQGIWQDSILKKFPLTSTHIEKQEKIEQKERMLIDEKHIFELVALLLEIEGFSKENIVKIQIGIPTPLEDTIEYNPENPVEANGIYYIPEKWDDKQLYAYFQEQGIGQKFKIIKRKVGNSSVNISKKNKFFDKNHINIGSAKDGTYDIQEKILPIIYDHEISTHINTGIGNFNNIYMKDPERSDLEEGIALFNQTMTKNKDIQQLYETSMGDIGMFLAENFDEHELKRIFAIYFTLAKEKNRKIDDQIRRNKMGVPIGEKGARRKDLTYGNGKEIIKELEELTKTEEGIALLNRYARSIYSTKLGYEAIKNIDTILDGIKKIDELEPNFPIFAGKIIYWKLFKGKLDKEKMLENDLRRLIDTGKGVTNKQKRLLVQILQLIKENSKKF